MVNFKKSSWPLSRGMPNIISKQQSSQKKTYQSDQLSLNKATFSKSDKSLDMRASTLASKKSILKMKNLRLSATATIKLQERSSSEVGKVTMHSRPPSLLVSLHNEMSTAIKFLRKDATMMISLASHPSPETKPCKTACQSSAFARKISKLQCLTRVIRLLKRRGQLILSSEANLGRQIT